MPSHVKAMERLPSALVGEQWRVSQIVGQSGSNVGYKMALWQTSHLVVRIDALRMVSKSVYHAVACVLDPHALTPASRNLPAAGPSSFRSQNLPVQDPN